jgi:hypothetical protein
MRRALLLLSLAAAAWTGVAWAAAAGSVTITLSPNKVAKASRLKVLAQGPFQAFSQLPKSVTLYAQRGFKSDPRSVPKKCTSTQTNPTPCPPKSQIGTGDANVHVVTNVGVGTGDYDVPFKIFLGPPEQAGDLASLVIQGSVTTPLGTQNLTGTGRLKVLHHGPWGMELIADVPQMQPPAGVTITVTLNRLSFSAGATRVIKAGEGRKRRARRVSLITNPPKCKVNWKAQLVATFTTGNPVTFPLTTTCRKH